MNKDEPELIGSQTKLGGAESEPIVSTVPDSIDDYLVSQTPDDPKLQVPKQDDILSPVTEITEKKTIQIILPTSKVDTSNL